MMGPTTTWATYKVAAHLDPYFGVWLARLGITIAAVVVFAWFLRHDSKGAE